MTKMGNLEKNGVVGGTEKTVLVGVNLDSQSKELLTWALVKVAQPGDRVVALHVLKNSGEVHTKDKSSVVCLVNTFDSVLSVYEGFCNLKQVDLKVKISRGPSVRKTLAQEAKNFGASTVIVGVSKNATLGSSVSIARYCAGQLPKSCSILAVSNGKIMFEREALALSHHQGVTEESRRTRIFGALQRTLSKNSKVLSNSSDDASTNEDSGTCSESGDSPQFHTRKSTGSRDLLSVNSYSEGGLVFTNAFKLNTPRVACHACKIESKEREKDKTINNKGKPDSLCRKPHISSDCPTADVKKEWALVPVQKLSAASNPIPLMINEMSELKPGWPLLRRKFLPNKGDSNSTNQVSVVQWAMQLPSRYSAAITSDYKSKKKDTSSPAIGNACNGNRRRELAPTDCVDDRKPRKEYENFPKELKTLYHQHASACRLFSYEVLARATSQFTSDNLVGKGGSSRVYKGRLRDGKELAVKILKSSNDAWKEFLLEIEMATTLKHKNIISLVGFCFTKDSFLLVYDFLSRGSLEENLHGTKKHLLSWAERYKVAIGVARALDYLHNANSPPVVHRDVKSSNILLSDSFEAQLSDFGLAKWMPASSHITCNDVAGTFGYLAPEYFMHGKVNDKIDVYSFGVVLLELLSGRKPISNEYPKGQESLVMWAMPLLQKGEFDKVLDPSLGKNYDASQMGRMMLAALTCLRRAPRFRPRMDVVLKLLQGDEDAAKWAKFQICIASEDLDGLEDEALPAPDIQSYLDLALLDVEEDSLSSSSMKKNIAQITKVKCLEDYLRRRGTLASSFG